MKIKRLKLVNFIGIKHGLDLDSVEIDFTKTNNKVIMLLGGNGAGKSVIMSMLHPFKESFDDRKDLIIADRVGEKEIDIIHGDHLYEIKHTYTKSAQSFIKKDGVELNENGGVRTFEDIILKEFGITKDYFKIGKIGSNTKNFVDFTTTDRKNYIGNFLNIEEILAKFDVANEKLKKLKKEISLVGNDLNKFQDTTIIETNIGQLSESSKQIETELFELIDERGTLNANIANHEESLNGLSSLEEINSRIAEKQNDIDTNEKIKNDVLAKNKDIEDISPELAKEISELQKTIGIKNSEIDNKVLLLTDYKNKITSTKIELSSLGNPEDIQKTKDEISKCEEKMAELAKSIRGVELSKLVDTMLKDKKDVLKYVEKTSNFLDFIEKYFTDLRSNSVINTKMNIELFFDESFSENLSRIIKNGKSLIESKKDQLSKLQRDRGVKETYVCQLKNLEQRPSECNIDTCPFIKDAYEHRNVLSEIDNVDSEIKTLKNDIESLTVKQENIQEIQSLYANFKVVYDALSVRDNDIYKHFTDVHPLTEWLSNSVSEFQKFKQDILDDIRSVMRDYNEYRSIKQHSVSLKNTVKILEDSDSTIRSKYESDIEELNQKKDALEIEIKTSKDELNVFTEELSLKQEIFELHQQYEAAKSKLESAKVMLNTSKSNLAKITDILTKKKDAEVRRAVVSKRIAELELAKNAKQSSLDKAKATLVQANILKEKLEKLNAEYKPVELVAEALNPNRGIPLILIKMYLQETEAITNDLLDIAFNGDFKIAFAATDKDFAIQVQSKGNLKSDIKMASQGEIAITTISISLALIEQSIGGYNILCLDEIDGNLDSNNRTNFMDILNSQIEKLGIEQVFVISHNDAFDTAPVGMVLLKGNTVNKNNTSFMENKDIIFDIEGVI